MVSLILLSERAKASCIHSKPQPTNQPRQPARAIQKTLNKNTSTTYMYMYTGPTIGCVQISSSFRQDVCVNLTGDGNNRIRVVQGTYNLILPLGNKSSIEVRLSTVHEWEAKLNTQ